MPGNAFDDAEDDTACTSCGDSSLTIDFSVAAALKCNLCGHKADEDTPLLSMTTIAASGGKWPWAKYRTIKDGESGGTVSRRPTGKYCGICRNTFNALGLDQTHNSIAKFYTFVAKPENAHRRLLLVLPVRSGQVWRQLAIVVASTVVVLMLPVLVMAPGPPHVGQQ